MWLESCSDAALAAGQNLAAVGSELIQFGVAEPLGGGRYRLLRLLRVRRGTEWAASAHGAGEAFVMIEPETLLALQPPAAAIGGQARVLASGIRDAPEGIKAAVRLSGEAMRPPSAVHFAWPRNAAGDVALRWVRRGRAGWDWLDGADAPLAEERDTFG